MTKMKKSLSSLAFAVTTCGALAAIADPSISVDAVAQRWPWNNKLDIKYTVSGGQDVAAEVFAKVVFTATIGGASYTVDGSSIGADASDGTHIATWTVPSGLRAKNCTMAAKLVSSDVPSGDDYMIVDLVTGNVAYEGLYVTQNESNTRYNTNDVYKTSKLLLRKVSAGEHKTGDWRDETHKTKMWTCTKDYYIGVYPVTQGQYETLCGVNPSEYTLEKAGNVIAHRPVENISWNNLRVEGTASTNPIPPVASAADGTFFQRLNYKTGRYFDLPTEVMFEIAERASTENATKTYWWGSIAADGVACAVCTENANGSTVAVGSLLPNAWGIYDTAGNVWEWCLDDDSLEKLWQGEDAFVPACSSGSQRRIRGGGPYSQSVNSHELNFRASTRTKRDPASGSYDCGFRVSYIVK